MLRSTISEKNQLSFFLNLDGYEGPIDMLLSLAREQKVDLTRIAILPLAEQYLKFVETAQMLDLEIAADYLVMAAWLAYLKSRLILPDPDPEEAGEVVNMTDALKFQLQRLEAMQIASQRLMQLPRLHTTRLVRGMPYQISITDKITFTATLYDLIKAYGDICSAHKSKPTSFLVYGKTSKHAGAKILEWDNAHLLVEDLNYVCELSEIASDVVPATSFAYMSSEFLSKK